MRNERRTCSRPAAPMRAISSGAFSRWRRRKAAPSTELTTYPVTSYTICWGSPPTKPPITGLPFHIASAAPRPNDSRTDFCSTMVAARCRALICSEASGGSSRTTTSGSACAVSRSSPRISRLSGSPPEVPARTSRTS